MDTVVFPTQLALAPDAVGCELAGVARVRRAVHVFLAADGMDAIEDDVLLVVSELVTNSIVHTADAPGVLVRHEHGPERVTIEVSDRSVEVPRRRVADARSVGGRGLAIVDRIATDWGVRIGDAGKTTWATLFLGGRVRPGALA